MDVTLTTVQWLWIGLGLLALWVVARLILAVTSYLIHLLWIGGLLVLGYWAFQFFLS